ncbi:MAG: AI-2E family transporter [Hormoscilla sp. GUM202]|nr:AI-2E family transporter [Hormoscilla sp. GUM202]
MRDIRITFSISGLLLIVASVLSIVVLWQLQSLLIILMISVVLAASISPLVETAERWHIPRWLGTIVVYLTLLSGLTGVGLLLGPAVTEQIQLLVKGLPVYAEKLIAVASDTITRWNDIPSDIFEFFDVQQFTSWLFRSSQQLVLRSYSITRGILGAAISLILSLFISGYMVADSQTLVRSVVRLFPQPWEERLAAQVPIISYRMGSYIRGRLLVSLILGIATTVGLGFLGLREFSLGLGVIAGVTNLIPFIGPVLGAIPALVVAIAAGGWKFLWILLFFVAIQNIETYVLDPFLVGSSVGLHPLYQLLAVVGGTQILGIIGALIVPPWMAGAAALIENLYLEPKQRAEQKTIVISPETNMPQ